MPTQPPDIILYDLACNKHVCFSPVVWRIRLLLNYKKIFYRTIFLEFPDIEPTLKELVPPPASISPAKPTYTVPTITHMPTSTSIMDSAAIAQFLNSTYPSPPLPLTSPIGQQIEAKARSTIGRAFATLVLPREPSILSTRSAAYFRAKTEASLGLALDDLLSEEKQGQAWELVEEEGMRELGEMLMTNRAEGPFVLGKEPSYTDFFVAGSLANVRVVDEGVFERLVGFEGFRGIYEACGAWMERNT